MVIVNFRCDRAKDDVKQINKCVELDSYQNGTAEYNQRNIRWSCGCDNKIEIIHTSFINKDWFVYSVQQVGKVSVSLRFCQNISSNYLRPLREVQGKCQATQR